MVEGLGDGVGEGGEKVIFFRVSGDWRRGNV